MKLRADELAAEKIDRARIKKKLKFCVHRVEICSFTKTEFVNFTFTDTQSLSLSQGHAIMKMKFSTPIFVFSIFISLFPLLSIFFLKFSQTAQDMTVLRFLLLKSSNAELDLKSLIKLLLYWHFGAA
jgi:hypothetical protein